MGSEGRGRDKQPWSVSQIIPWLNAIEPMNEVTTINGNNGNRRQKIQSKQTNQTTETSPESH
jgi:hypothetical protein